MNSLVRDLLDLARIEADRFAVSPAPETIGSLIEDAIELLRSTAENKKIELSVEDDRQFQMRVLADRERVFQVLSNLIGNALKFTPPGGHVRVGVFDKRDMFEFDVRDDGAGIASDQLPRLFDRYWQARARADGSGLGLYIAKGIVEAHHGRIWVESELGAGTTVGFTLPRA
jgi:signal transduction histidine kinase